MTEVETREWLRGAKAKPSLALYSATKTTIGREKFFDNSLGSGLLAEARLGVLRTRMWRAKFTAGLDTTCATCGAAEETTKHVVLECPAITPAPEGQTLSAALGFEEAGGAAGVDNVKRRLEVWWRHGALRPLRRRGGWNGGGSTDQYGAGCDGGDSVVLQ